MNSEWIVGQHVRSDYQVSIDSFIGIFSSFLKLITLCISAEYAHRLFLGNLFFTLQAENAGLLYLLYLSKNAGLSLKR